MHVSVTFGAPLQPALSGLWCAMNVALDICVVFVSVKAYLLPLLVSPRKPNLPICANVVCFVFDQTLARNFEDHKGVKARLQVKQIFQCQSR